MEFLEYFTTAWTCLKDGGLLFTSVPNQEAGLPKGYGKMLNFEHPSVCTNLHWIYLHYKNRCKRLAGRSHDRPGHSSARCREATYP